MRGVSWRHVDLLPAPTAYSGRSVQPALCLRCELHAGTKTRTRHKNLIHILSSTFSAQVSIFPAVTHSGTSEDFSLAVVRRRDRPAKQLLPTQH